MDGKNFPFIVGKGCTPCNPKIIYSNNSVPETDGEGENQGSNNAFNTFLR